MNIRPTTIQEVRAIIQEKVVGRVASAPSPLGEHDQRHWYSIDGTAPGLSVTQVHGIISKPHLYKWYAMKALEKFVTFMPVLDEENKKELMQKCVTAGEDTRDDAGAVGTKGHDIAEEWLNIWIASGTRHPDIRQLFREGDDTRSIAFARSVQKFFEDHPQYEPISSELKVGVAATPTLPFIAGTLDILLWNKGTEEVEVWDWKSSNQVSDSYALQVAAYRYAFEDMTGIKTAEFCGIVKGSKYSDKYEIFFVTDPDKALAAHKAASELYGYFEDGSEKLVPDKVVVTL